MWTRTALLCLPLLTGLAGPAAAQAPLSGVDWLSDVLAEPVVPDEPPVSSGAAFPEVTVRPLDMPMPDAIGLVPRSQTGLPADLWGNSSTEALARRMTGFPASALPAARDLHQLLLTAEVDPPKDATPDGRLLLARVDALLALGDLSSAGQLLKKAGAGVPAFFRRGFDVALLTGHEDRACADLRRTPGIAPSIPARVFCLARTGDWPAAALTLETAEALGQLTPDEDELLARFLDAAIADGAEPMPPIENPTPLDLKMREAIGEPLHGPTLPVAFAHSDLHGPNSWRTRVEAGERLTRAGVYSPQDLAMLYAEREAAASGGVWDRVAAMQAFEAAMGDGRPRPVAELLPGTWSTMRSAGLDHAFASLYGTRLAKMDLPPSAADLALRIGLLTPSYERIAASAEPKGAEAIFLVALARGMPGAATATSPLATAIADAFAEDPAPDLPAALESLRSEGKLGEALLVAANRIARGRGTDYGTITGTLAFLRDVGLEDRARRIGLELMLLERGA
ncbi:hypothetical protein [Tropicimonas sp. IMCC34011]|uniref:hypothetical protein n=1 Tax=Tropicimonas sp. IMCC34011 TaxID=2248759 RepID=UPI000E27700A|nr:hypothetical protein [Tropicimonas sp. IMCC34011]